MGTIGVSLERSWDEVFQLKGGVGTPTSGNKVAVNELRLKN